MYIYIIYYIINLCQVNPFGYAQDIYFIMKKQDFSKKILKILSKKTAVSLPQITDDLILDSKDFTKSKYAITRSIKNLEEKGLIEKVSSDQNNYARITTEGRKKNHSIELEAENALININWDGYWRMIILDLPEERKNEREALRYLLKKAGFLCAKNSVWISMYPYEHMFTNIKKDLGLTTEMMIIVTDKIDKESESAFLEIFGFKN